MSELQPASALILASGSPRRRLLLSAAGFTFDVVRPDVDETPLPDEDAAGMVLRLADAKSSAVERGDRTVLAADTTVVRDGEMLGKPTDAEDALEILISLVGRSHSVLTGWMVRLHDAERFGVSESIVRFNHRTPAELSDYIERTQPFDKAGAYGIQGDDGFLIDSVVGSRANVMGLPIGEVTDALTDVGVVRSAPNR